MRRWHEERSLMLRRWEEEKRKHRGDDRLWGGAQDGFEQCHCSAGPGLMRKAQPWDSPSHHILAKVPEKAKSATLSRIFGDRPISKTVSRISPEPSPGTAPAGGIPQTLSAVFEASQLSKQKGATTCRIGTSGISGIS